MLVSLILAFGSLVLVWRGLDGLPRAKLVRYALIWGVIILAVVLVLRVVGA
jgi:hypothetical protein